MISFQDAIPLIVFLVTAFLAFYFLETVILFTLNRLIRRYAVFVIDRLLSTIVHHRTLIRMVAVGSVALLIALLFIFTPLADVLVANNPAFRLLALVLIFTMAVIYWIGHSTIDQVVIERRIHQFIFTIFSLLSFAIVMSLAKEGYVAYADVVDRTFVRPIVSGIENQYEKRVEERLLTVFREKVKDGKCEQYDYTTKKGTELTQFVFVKDDPALAFPSPNEPVLHASAGPLQGKNCTHQTKFLLTPDGKWYEVIETN